MKKLILFFCLSFLFINIYPHTNKTFIRPVPIEYFLPKRFDFNNFIDKSNPDITFDIDITSFYFSSNRSSQIGKYFGTNNKNEIIFSNYTNSKADIMHNYLIKGLRQTDSAVSKLVLNPKTIYSGVNFSALFDLFKLKDNLYLKFNLAYMKVQNNLHPSFSGQNYQIWDYLIGRYQDFREESLQTPLEFAKITNQQSKQGVPFFDLSLAYNFYYKDHISSLFKVGFIIPIENHNKAEYLFEPTFGNADHFGLTCGVQGSYLALSKEKSSLDINWDINYKYLFANTQKRTLGIKGASLGQYYLLGRRGQQNEPLTPAANLLTQNLRVSPGSQLDINLEALFKYHKFKLTFGGNVLARQKEDISWKKSIDENKYAVIVSEYDTDKDFSSDGEVVIDNATKLRLYHFWLNNNSIDIDVARCPAVLSYTIYSQFGFDYKKDDLGTLFTVNLGGSINIADENSAFSGYGLWFDSIFYF